MCTNYYMCVCVCVCVCGGGGGGGGGGGAQTTTGCQATSTEDSLDPQDVHVHADSHRTKDIAA